MVEYKTICACCDCPNMQYGRQGDMCKLCDEHGCSYEPNSGCDAPDPYRNMEWEDSCND